MTSAYKSTALVAEYDESVHYTSILTKGDEQEFIKFVKNQVDCNKKWLAAELDKSQLREFITKLTAEKDGLEVKLKHARSQVDIEMKRRVKAEAKQDELEGQIALIRELLSDKGTLSEKERESLAFLDRTTLLPMEGTPNNRLSAIHESSADLLDPSDLTDDDLEMSVLRDGKKWIRTASTVKRRPSAPPLEDENTPPKKSKTDTSVVTTTVTVSANGPITATSHIETGPQVNTRSCKKPTRFQSGYEEEEDSFWSKPENQSLKTALFTAPSSPLLPQTPPPRTPPAHLQQRKHEFVTKTVIRPESCGPCAKKVKFGKYALKCRNCRVVCHPDCKDGVPLPCIPVAGTPGKQPPTRLEEFVPNSSPQIPHLVVQCVEEIEFRGMKEQGLYRLSGSDKQMKELKERLVMGKDGKLDKITDIHVICSTLKDFLRKLEEPIITFALHENFMNAAAISNADDSMSALYQAVSELPYPNRDTLAYIMLHLQRVAASEDCKMPKSNLAKVFGPTLVRHNCPDPEPMQVLNDTKLQPLVVDRLLSIPADFWKSFTEVDTENRMPGSDNVIANGHAMTPDRYQQTSVRYGKSSAECTPTLNKRNTRNVAVHNTDMNNYTPAISKQKRSIRSKSKNAPSSMLGPVHTPPVSANKMGKKTPSSSSVSGGKNKSIFSKTPITPRFGSRTENRSKKTTTFFSSPTLR